MAMAMAISIDILAFPRQRHTISTVCTITLLKTIYVLKIRVQSGFDSLSGGLALAKTTEREKKKGATIAFSSPYNWIDRLLEI